MDTVPALIQRFQFHVSTRTLTFLTYDIRGLPQSDSTMLQHWLKLIPSTAFTVQRPAITLPSKVIYSERVNQITLVSK
jgi:hypothetical protein